MKIILSCLVKKIQVSKEDGRTFFELAEANNQKNCLVWNCRRLGNLRIEKKAW